MSFKMVTGQLVHNKLLVDHALPSKILYIWKLFLAAFYDDLFMLVHQDPNKMY